MQKEVPVANNWYDPRTGAEPMQFQSLSLMTASYEPARTNYFTIYWIEAGSGSFWADATNHEFSARQLLFFLPYQHIRIMPDDPVQASVLQFHANFLCVETFHAETGCSGTLFNDPYGVPAVALDDRATSDVLELLARIRREFEDRHSAYLEALLACMKLLLIVAARLKSAQCSGGALGGGDFRHPVLGPLRELIEKNYRELHSPSDYAALLHITMKAVGRCVREQLGKTLTDLIRERILTHAKWQLLHTLRPVKEIAAEVGFRDELYFSRLFKKATGVSPTFFREFETLIRNGSNLSMTLSHTPIPKRSFPLDDGSISRGGSGTSEMR